MEFPSLAKYPRHNHLQREYYVNASWPKSIHSQIRSRRWGLPEGKAQRQNDKSKSWIRDGERLKPNPRRNSYNKYLHFSAGCQRANDTTLDLIQYSSDVVFPHWRGDAVFSHRMAWRSEKIFVADCELDLPITCYISEFPPCAAYSRSTRQPMWFIISLFIWIFPRQHTCINGQY